MSLFKTREWWSNTVGDGEEFDTGCLCVANIDNSSNGIDKIIVGSFHGYLRVYNPTPQKLESGGWSGFKPSDVVCELHVGGPILQVEAGRFVSGTPSLHLAVLQPRKLAVYTLVSQTGRAEHGNQYELKLAYEHKLQRTAFNFCYGAFGGVQGRDFICIQSMDGTVSIFEQEGFAFSRFLPNALLPGPIRYLPRTDSFVTVSSSRQVETYKYQVLATATDAKTKEESQNLRSGKKVASDWVFSIGEQALDINIYSSNSGTTINVLGERSLYILTEGGKLKNMKKFDYNPSCFLPYISMSGDAVNTLVGTHTNTLMVYQDVTLRWAAQLSHVPVQIHTATFNDLKGVIVTLTEEGYLTCSYLGTDPSMFTPPTAEVRELDYALLDQEMKQLQREIKEQQSKQSINLPTSKQEDDLEIQVQVPSDLDPQPHTEDIEYQDEDVVPSITVKVILRAKTHINDVKLSISVTKPLYASETFITYPSLAHTSEASDKDLVVYFNVVEPSRPGETCIVFYQKYNVLAADLRADVTASYLSSSGAPRVVNSVIKLPLKLVMKAWPPVKNAMYKITIDTNKPPVNLNDVFPDLLGDSVGGAGNALGFKYYGSESIVTVLASKTSQRYRLQCDQFEDIWLILDEFSRRLHSHHARSGARDFKVSYEGALPLQEYFDVLDKHFECRLHDEKFKKMLEERACQFRAIQRRLLTRFKDKTPSPLANLDTLLDGTYRQLLALAEHTEENLTFQEKCSCRLSAATRMLTALVRAWQDLSDTEYAVLEHAITPCVCDNGQYGWEEMVDAAITHLLRTCLAKSTKDQTVNPSPLTMLRDTQKLKKHIALVCDRLSKGAKLQVEGHQPVITNTLQAPLSDIAKPSKHKPSSSPGNGPNINNLSAAYGSEASSASHKPLGEAEVPIGSKFGETKSSKKGSMALPSLSNGDTQGLPSLSEKLPPLTDPDDESDDHAGIILTEQTEDDGGGGSKFLKKRPTDLVPDLDDMETNGDDLTNGTQGLIYDMADLGL